MKLWLLLVLALVAPLAAPAQFSQVAGAVDSTQSQFEVYPVPFADPAAVEQVAKAIIGPGGTVVYDAQNKRLLVAAPRSKHQELKAMMDKLNVVPPNVRIDVEFKVLSDTAQSEASLSAEGEITREDGIDSTTIRIKPKVMDENVRGSSNVKQSLLVASGREGTLNIGRSVPYLEWLMGYAGASANVRWQQVGARLVVEPFVVGQGPLIRLRITPELSGTVDGRPLHTRFSAAATEVTVESGQSVSLGGMARDETFYSRFLIGRSSADTQEQIDIVLTPRIMDVHGP
jgi:hypothetical protein